MQSSSPFVVVAQSICSVLFVQMISLAMAAEPQQLRVLTYNIHHGRGMDNRVDLERIAKLIVDSKADLVALQEVDNKTRRTGGVDQTAELAKLTGLHGGFAKAIDFEGGEYGQALLSRWPINSIEVELLPGEPDRERRIIAVGKLTLDGKPLLFCSTHLHHADANFRLRQTQSINMKFASESRIGAMAIMAGDLNAEPNSPPLLELSKQWTIAKPVDQPNLRLLTFPSTNPKSQIDYVLYRSESHFQVQSIKVIDEPMASDHRPVLAVLEMPK